MGSRNIRLGGPAAVGEVAGKAISSIKIRDFAYMAMVLQRHSTGLSRCPVELERRTAANGVIVEHITPSGEVRAHKMMAGAKIVDGLVTYPGQPTLFDLDGK